jgi:hypothetical protein
MRIEVIDGLLRRRFDRPQPGIAAEVELLGGRGQQWLVANR